MRFLTFFVIISKFSFNVIYTLVAATFKTWVCGGSLVGIAGSGIAGSNSVEVLDISLVSVVCCHLEVFALDQ